MTPVRFAAPADHEAMQAAIAANPHDDAPSQIYADMLEEEGRTHLADAYRRTTYQGQRPYLGDSVGSSHEWNLGSAGGHQVAIHIHNGSDAQGPTGKRFAKVILSGHEDSGVHRSYETEDHQHIHDLAMELAPDEPSWADEIRQQLTSPVGNRVRLTGNSLGHYTLTHDDGRDQYFQSEYDYPSLAHNFGWRGDHYDINGAREHLDSMDGEIIEDPGYFENHDQNDYPDPPDDVYRNAREGQPVRMGMDDIVPILGAAHQGANKTDPSGPHDDAPVMILADALRDAGMHAHADHLMLHMGSKGVRGRKEVSHYANLADRHPQRHELAKWLGDNPGRFVINHSAGDSDVTLFSGIPLPRTSRGKVRAGHSPAHVSFRHTFPSAAHAEEHIERLRQEGAILLRYRGNNQWTVHDWPNQGDAHENFEREGDPVKLAMRPIDRRDPHANYVPPAEHVPETSLTDDDVRLMRNIPKGDIGAWRATGDHIFTRGHPALGRVLMYAKPWDYSHEVGNMMDTSSFVHHSPNQDHLYVHTTLFPSGPHAKVIVSARKGVGDGDGYHKFLVRDPDLIRGLLHENRAIETDKMARDPGMRDWAEDNIGEIDDMLRVLDERTRQQDQPARMAKTVKMPGEQDPVTLEPHHPKFEPDLAEYLRHRFAGEYGMSHPEDEAHEGTGYILPDGTPVNMGDEHLRYDDHRSAIPFHSAMVQWGWPKDVTDQYIQGNREPALQELIKRSRAVRVHMSPSIVSINSNSGLTSKQRDKITSYVMRAKPTYMRVTHMGKTTDLEHPGGLEADDHLRRLPSRMMRDRLKQAVKMAKAGRPVRMGAADSRHIFDAIKANPHDDAPWMILADSFEEDGKMAAGDLMRKLATSLRVGGDGYEGPSRVHRSGAFPLEQPTERIAGHIHGVPFSLHSYPSQHIVRMSDSLRGGPALASISREHGDALIGEMDSVKCAPIGRRFAKEGPSVKMGMWDEKHSLLDPALVRGLAYAGQDEAPWRIFGDHLQDVGYFNLGQLLATSGRMPFEGEGGRGNFNARNSEKDCSARGHKSYEGVIHRTKTVGYQTPAMKENGNGDEFLRHKIRYDPASGEAALELHARSYKKYPERFGSHMGDSVHIVHVPQEHLLGVLHDLRHMMSQSAVTHTAEDDYGLLNRHDEFIKRVERRASQPERFAYQAPAGGLLARGIFYKVGSFVPESAWPQPPETPQATSSPPADKKTSTRSRISRAIRSKNRSM